MEFKDITNEKFAEMAKKLGDALRMQVDSQLLEILKAQEEYDKLKRSGCEVDDVYRAMSNGMSYENALKNLNDEFDRLRGVTSELSLDQLKKQIKYAKNPLEVKRLNIKLNEMYKKRRKR